MYCYILLIIFLEKYIVREDYPYNMLKFANYDRKNDVASYICVLEEKKFSNSEKI